MSKKKSYYMNSNDMLYRTSGNTKDQIEMFNLLQDLKTIGSNRLSHLLEPYIKSISYYPSNLFFDHVHLEDTATPEDYLGILN